MDITQNKTNRFTNSYINGETVNYVISVILSFFVLIVSKQALKIFGLGTNAACWFGFALGETALYFLEKYFVYKENALNDGIRQIVFAIISGAMHLGIYGAVSSLGKILGREIFLSWFFSLIFVAVINYPVSRILVFDCMEPAQKRKNGRVYKKFFSNRFVILSMGISLFLMLFILAIFNAFPFGDTTVLRMDLYHQYGPLFVELYDRVTHFKSFAYSWTSGGGSSFLGNFFNYLASPFSAILFLFDRKDMAYAITSMMIAKCVCSAGSFTFYLKRSLGKHSVASAVFGIFYAFSAYFLAYFWNIMWLDGMIILPLIALGIESIINKGSGKLYLLSLVYILYSSYYMGYMCCIFSVIYFAAYCFITKNNSKLLNENEIYTKKFSIKKLLNYRYVDRALRFAAFSLLAGLICAVVLLPVFFILKSCSATSDNTPNTAESYFTLFDFIETHFAALETTIRSSGNDILPNVYTSVLTIILVPLYFANGKIRFKEKAIYGILIALFFISFNNNYVNFFWHAFHFPNDLPFRYSYMYCFILLVVAFKALEKINELRVQDIVLCGLFWVGIVAVASELPTEKLSETSIYVTAAFLVIYTGVLVVIKKNAISKFVAGVLVAAMAFCEVVIADPAAFGFNQKQSGYIENYDTYREAVNYISENDKSDYRTELCTLNTRMDDCLYGYNGMSIFSSMAYEDYSGSQYSLGMYGNRINSYTYNTQTPVYNMMYNLKYLIKKNSDGDLSNELYAKCFETENGAAAIYENRYFLPKVFCVNEAISGWSTEEGNPFEVQSDFFTLATGYSNVFIPASYTNTSYTGMSGEDIAQSGTQWIEKTTEASYAQTDITIQAEENGNLYLYVTASDIDNISVIEDENSESYSIDTPYIIDLGYHAKGSSLTVSLDCASMPVGESSVEIYAYSINQNALTLGYNKLRKGAMEVSKHTDTVLSGKVTASENSILYSSIPYDEGWSVYIDGEKTETFKIGGSQLGVMIKPGEHSVKYVYTPKGVYLGAGISAGALISTAAIFVIYRRKKANNDKLVKS